MLRRSLLGLLVLWSAAALLAEVRGALTSWDDRPHWRGPAESWRFGSPQAARLERCLAPVRRLLPAGSVVAFAAADQSRGDALLVARWAAYLMPAHNVMAREDPAAGAMAEWVVAYGAPIQEPGAELVRRLPECQLYRVRRP